MLKLILFYSAPKAEAFRARDAEIIGFKDFDVKTLNLEYTGPSIWD